MSKEQHANSTETVVAKEVQNADRLARQLIRHLGVAGATKTCRENHWDGVLSAIQAQARSGSAI